MQLVAVVSISGCIATLENPQNDRVYAPAAARERRCTRTSAADTVDLRQISDGVRGVSNLGRMVLILIDAGVNVAKINVAYTTREVLLTQTLLPVAREICAEFFIFQQ